MLVPRTADTLQARTSLGQSSPGNRPSLLARIARRGRCFAWSLVFAASSTLAGGALAQDSKKPVVDSTAQEAPATQPKGPAQARPTVDSLGDALPAGALLRLGTSRFRPPSGVDELALSPDEKTVVTLGRQLIAWDTATGKERWRANDGDIGFDKMGAAYGVHALAFCSDGTRFYTPGGPNEVEAWETLSGRHETLPIESAKHRRIGLCRSIDMTPDGQLLALGSDLGVVVCDQDRRALYAIANNPKGPLDVNKDRLKFRGHYSLARFSPDAKMLAVVTSDAPEAIRLFESDGGDELRKIKLKANLVRLTFSPDSKQLATTERDSAIRLYDVESAKEIWSHVVQLTNPNENYTSAIAFSPDAKTVAACATDDRIYLVDAANGKEAKRLVGTAWYPWALAYTADGKMLYSSGWDGAVRRWDVVAGEQIGLPEGVRATGVVAASPDGRTLAYADGSGSIRLVDAASAAERKKLELPGTTYTKLAFAPDSLRLAGAGTSDDDVRVAVWDLASGNVRHRWDWPKGKDPHSTVESLAFTPNGNRLAAAVFRQSMAYVWDLTMGQELAHLPHKEIYGLSWNPDSATLATAGWDSVVRFWHLETKVGGEFDIKQGLANGGDLRMYAVRYAPDGSLVATAHLDGNVRVWQADNMVLRQTFKLDGRFIYGAINFSPDGLWLATGSMDGSVRLWDPLAGKIVWDVGKHQGYVYTVSFAEGVRTLLSGGADGLAYLWDLRPPANRPNKGLEYLWNDLTGDDSAAAFQAMWDLCETRDAIAFVVEKLRPIRYVVDPDRDGAGLSIDETETLKRLKQKLLDKDNTTERSVTVRRAVSLLAHSGTAEALKALRDLASQDPIGEVGRLATATLERLELVKTP
jgi:WD40 repeat protein